MTQRRRPGQIIYIQDRRTQTKLRKNKVWELNHFLVSSLPTPEDPAIYKLRGQALPQSRKGLPITVEISRFPFLSWGWSDLRTKSPTLKSFVPALCLSNHLFTTSFCCLKHSLALDWDSSAFRRLYILICKTSLSDPLDSWAIMEEGSMILGGRMASLPYTRVYGDTPIEYLWVTLSAQRAFGNAACQLLWFSITVFFKILIRFLFVDSTKPFPYG